MSTAPAFDSRAGAALAALRREITLGRFKDADLLPGERDLADLLGVSRTTLRRLLAILVEDGLLTHRQGVGTFVRRSTNRPPEAAPGHTGGFAATMLQQGRRPETRELRRLAAAPGPEEAMALGCGLSEPLVYLWRLRLADDVLLAIEKTVSPVAFAGPAERVGRSLRASLAARGFAPARLLERVQAGPLDAGEAAALDGVPGGLALIVRRTAYLADGRCCLYTRTVHRADRYDSVTEEVIPPRDTGRPRP